MPLLAAKDLIERWAGVIWPNVEVTCPQCHGKGVVVTSQNTDNPMYYPHTGLAR